jgi:hypothetical protein
VIVQVSAFWQGIQKAVKLFVGRVVNDLLESALEVRGFAGSSCKQRKDKRETEQGVSNAGHGRGELIKNTKVATIQAQAETAKGHERTRIGVRRGCDKFDMTQAPKSTMQLV